jgi:formiminotetrahydrofolate cyclodeaminase
MQYRAQSLDGFLSGVASNRVAPAGGTATAVVGALGAALCEMVCIHTVENGDSGAAATGLADVRDDLHRQRGHLLGLADTDGRVVDELFGADSGVVDQSDVKRSIGVPLTIADACLNVLELATDVTETGTRNAVADAATGVILTRSALRAAVFTVRRNVDQVSDSSFVEDVERDVAELEKRADEASERAIRNVEERT